MQTLIYHKGNTCVNTTWVKKECTLPPSSPSCPSQLPHLLPQSNPIVTFMTSPHFLYQPFYFAIVFEPSINGIEPSIVLSKLSLNITFISPFCWWWTFKLFSVGTIRKIAALKDLVCLWMHMGSYFPWVHTWEQNCMVLQWSHSSG